MTIDTSRPGYVILFAGLVSAVFTAGIMTLHVATAERVERNKELLQARAEVELFGLGDVRAMSDREIVETARRRIAVRAIRHPETGREFKLLEAYDPDKDSADAKIAGRGFYISGSGFWARIRGLLALKPDLTEIIGVAFLDHSETPGLGARITERAFRDQFKGLKATPPAQGGRFIYIDATGPTGPGDPRYGRHVDAITGATGTSAAVERFVNEDLRQFRGAAEAAGLVGKGAAVTR